eukprot:TRINITY_DN1743_c0_g2_i2.p1 TRINITY_DN1743_c0_g2~~TRINITY_DN1743_c0_g2_i2.p1  ORF type:complete len:528 (+),score=60.79 TRINITY_DN1743_c0_g2_i2:47-1630(+)
MNWFLIVVAIVVVLVTLVVNFRILHVYLDPEEKFQGGGYFPKFIVILGLSMSAFVSLLLPFDVANKKDPTIRDDTGGEIDVALMWQITLWAICGMSIVVLPFALFYYEAWDPDAPGTTIEREVRDTSDNVFRIVGTQIVSATCWTSATVIGFVGLLCIIYYAAGINEAILPYESHRCEGFSFEVIPCPRWEDNATQRNSSCADNLGSFASTEDLINSGVCGLAEGDLHIKVSLFVGTIAVLTSLGWILFVVFGGVGLCSLPLDMCHSFHENKLVAMSREKFVAERERIKGETRDLLAVADSITEKLRRNKTQQKKVNALQVRVDTLEKQHRRNQAYDQSSPFAKLTSPFVIYGRLLLAIFTVVWSILWIAHIIINNTLDFNPLLNTAFKELDGAFSLLGTVFYASFSFYLLWATVNGCMHVGMNFLVITIHPMKPKATLVSSFCFNTILILFASVAVVSFCALSFRDYAANTVVDTLYSSYVSKMKYLSYIMEYLQYGLLGFAFLSLCYFTCKGPRNMKQLLEEKDE